MSRNHVVAGISFLLIACAFAQAQSSQSSKAKLDPASLVKIAAVVEDIEQRDSGGACKAQITYVIVKADEQSYALKVGPKWFLDELTAAFAKGEKLEITGWKVVKDQAADAKDSGSAPTEIVVRKIKRGDWLFEPRDDKGASNWSWMKPPKDSGKCI